MIAGRRKNNPDGGKAKKWITSIVAPIPIIKESENPTSNKILFFIKSIKYTQLVKYRGYLVVLIYIYLYK